MRFPPIIPKEFGAQQVLAEIINTITTFSWYLLFFPTLFMSSIAIIDFHPFPHLFLHIIIIYHYIIKLKFHHVSNLFFMLWLSVLFFLPFSSCYHAVSSVFTPFSSFSSLLCACAHFFLHYWCTTVYVMQCDDIHVNFIWMKGVKRRAALVITRKLVMFKDDLEIACHECFGGLTSHKLSKKEGVVLVGIKEDGMFLCQKSVLGRWHENFCFSVSLFSCHAPCENTMIYR